MPGNFVGADEASLLFYNRESGLAQFYTALGGVDIQEQSSAFWSPGWTHIVAGGSAEGFESLLFYNSVSGVSQFYTVDGTGDIHLLSDATTWRKSWALITSIEG